MILENLTETDRKTIGALALAGLLLAFVLRDDEKVYAAARRILFSDSIELKRIASLCDISLEKLHEIIFQYFQTIQNEKEQKIFFN